MPQPLRSSLALAGLDPAAKVRVRGSYSHEPTGITATAHSTTNHPV
ncbi:hypothetical protein [Rhizobium ruizarguesonis]